MAYKKLTKIPPGQIEEIDTEAEMMAVLQFQNLNKCYKFTGTSSIYVTGDLYVVQVNQIDVNLDKFTIPDDATQLNITDELEA